MLNARATNEQVGVIANLFLLVVQFCLVLMVIDAPERAFAAVCNTSGRPGLQHDYQLLTGYSPKSSKWIGTVEDRKFVLAGFAYSYRCWTAGVADISYTAGVLPVAVLLQPALPNIRSLSPRVIPKHAVYGVGVLPVGFTVHFGRHVVQPLFETHGGIIASIEPVPVNTTDATGLNFLFDFGAGVRFKIGDHHAVSSGYKFLHISNAYTTNSNPGVDNNVLFVGFSFLR